MGLFAITAFLRNKNHGLEVGNPKVKIKILRKELAIYEQFENKPCFNFSFLFLVKIKPNIA